MIIGPAGEIREVLDVDRDADRSALGVREDALRAEGEEHSGGGDEAEPSVITLHGAPKHVHASWSR